jgi:hypothetical protein
LRATAFGLIFRKAAVQEGETSEKLIESLDRIARIIFRADEYSRLFANEQTLGESLLQQLYDDLVELFVEVLTFLFSAMCFFKKRSLSKHRTRFKRTT